jgi:hypothetical protein
VSRSNFNAAIVHWEDRSFVTAFEQARDQVEAEGLTLRGPEAAARAEALLRDAGYPRALIVVSRTVDDAIARIAHWTVWREAPSRRVAG